MNEKPSSCDRKAQENSSLKTHGMSHGHDEQKWKAIADTKNKMDQVWLTPYREPNGKALDRESQELDPL